jgi:hypothetical protein
MKYFPNWLALTAILAMTFLPGCKQRNVSVHVPQAASGVKEITPEVKVGSDGLTNEQRNVRDRYAQDSMPGAIKHLYIISAYSGDVIIYSTVRGKVTSSGKRLTPTSVQAGYFRAGETHYEQSGIPVVIGGRHHLTSEVLQDDGSYGSSIEYLYWFDSKGIYHQHYVAGGQIVHVASEPLAVKRVIINMESKSVEE